MPEAKERQGGGGNNGDELYGKVPLQAEGFQKPKRVCQMAVRHVQTVTVQWSKTPKCAEDRDSDTPPRRVAV